MSETSVAERGQAPPITQEGTHFQSLTETEGKNKVKMWQSIRQTARAWIESAKHKDPLKYIERKIRRNREK